MVYCLSVSTMMDPLKGGPGQMSPMPSILIQPCWDPHIIFLKLNTLF